MSDRTRIVVLGAGPAGLGAALWLAERRFDVEVLEKQGAVGGNAGSFELAGVRVDFGSHRLHPAADPAILGELRKLLGDDLLARPRHGRIHLRSRWIHFPLRPLDLALRLPPAFAIGAGLDALRKLAPVGAATGEETFATVLERGLGKTICRDFYFPYARKIWGLEPAEIDVEQARRRVGAGSIGKLLRRLLPAAGGASGGGAPRGVFYYPRRGYGQISECLADAARHAGARVTLDAGVRRVSRAGNGFDVAIAAGEGERTLAADRVWSTIPAPVLARLLDPPPSEAVLEAAGSLELRAMVLVYLVLDCDRFSEYDAHYFPGEEAPFTRVSEPKNYAARPEPRGRTVLCAEIPCTVGDAVWSRPDHELREIVAEGLGRAGLPLPAQVVETTVRRLPAAYPVYRRGYERHFERLDGWLDGIGGLLSFGRQGLFAHDNTHHTLAMARAAVDCLDDEGRFDAEAWGRHRAVFATHVVED